jgi:hypothetical protein
MQENIFVVYPGAWWGWEVVREGEDEPMCFDGRRLAIDYARAMAIAMSPSVVRVENARGIVKAEWHTRSAERVDH